ncbi:hypothetical protein FHR81_002108 [Actinoalloteichus hoggarensis]|uniref:hypothetical protein n=1 Tax=Actinoalloteichus hoggarensis TaxID=1470176 RepID=UPI0012FDD105|nr:hypothetical protein [Actinoalloteichus hoggarensis]MBB5921070.1 hypothetical protein [Actinoalloteichus hoggarensis]
MGRLAHRLPRFARSRRDRPDRRPVQCGGVPDPHTKGISIVTDVEPRAAVFDLA